MPDLEDVIQLEEAEQGSRFFVAIGLELQPVCFVAQAWVSDYTYFRNHLLNSLDMIHLINDA